MSIVILTSVFCLVGSLLGGFVGAYVYRILERGQFWPLVPRRCEHCCARIPWGRNIPVLSWVIRNGAALCCGHGLTWSAIIAEVLGAGAGAGLVWLFLPELLAWVNPYVQVVVDWV